jgi:hypothetical protein
VYQRIDTEMSGISDAIHNHTQQMREAADRSRAQQAEIFRSNEEKQRQQLLKSRRCAEELARDGEYGFFSDCGHSSI